MNMVEHLFPTVSGECLSLGSLTRPLTSLLSGKGLEFRTPRSVILEVRSSSQRARGQPLSCSRPVSCSSWSARHLTRVSHVRAWTQT